MATKRARQKNEQRRIQAAPPCTVRRNAVRRGVLRTDGNGHRALSAAEIAVIGETYLLGYGSDGVSFLTRDDAGAVYVIRHAPTLTNGAALEFTTRRRTGAG